MFRTNNCSS